MESYNTEIDKKLLDEIIKIKAEDSYINGIFLFCESQSDRKRLLDFILSGHNERKEVLLMASQIGIESGTVEGELIDDYE